MIQHVIHHRSTNGSVDSRTVDLPPGRVIVGRGGSSGLILKSHLVSLEHAAFLEHDGRLSVEDLGSSGGTSVNGLAITRQVLVASDRVTLGDISFTVEKTPAGWALIEHRSDGEREDLGALVAAQARRLDIRQILPSYRVMSLGLGLVAIGIFFVRPLMGGSAATWSSGPLSSHHSMLEQQCTTCHALPFQQVRDVECNHCHAMSEHAASRTGSHEQAKGMRCAQCHMEHNGSTGAIAFTPGEAAGRGLILADSQLCIDCHADPESLEPNTALSAVTSFFDHPEFSVSLRSPEAPVSPTVREGEETAASKALRVRLDDSARLRDPTALKLNHALHLKANLRGADGPTSLTCSSCHHYGEGKRFFLPITMERDCASCHPLTFDERLPKKEVPHGDARTVFNYLYAEYAKLFLAEQGTVAAQVVASRFLPGRASPASAAPSEEKITRTAVVREARSAEKLLFERTACQLCHEVAEGPGTPEKDAQGVSLNRYEIVAPHLPSRWMPGAEFDHGAHQELTCESCHEGVSTSEKTSDVLMPGIKQCRTCHHSGHQRAAVNAACITCHSYHEEEELEISKKRTLKTLRAP